MAAGYDATELHDILKGLDFGSFKDKTWEDHIPVAGPVLSALLEKGVFKGDRFLQWIDKLLAEKDVRTFADLVDPEYPPDSPYRYKLRVVASDITGHELLLLPQAAERFGMEPSGN